MVMVVLVIVVIGMHYIVISKRRFKKSVNFETIIVTRISDIPGKIANHQLPVKTYFKVSLKMFPIAGISGENPKPKNVSVDSCKMQWGIARVKPVAICVKRLGIKFLVTSFNLFLVRLFSILYQLLVLICFNSLVKILDKVAQCVSATAAITPTAPFPKAKDIKIISTICGIPRTALVKVSNEDERNLLFEEENIETNIATITESRLDKTAVKSEIDRPDSVNCAISRP